MEISIWEASGIRPWTAPGLRHALKAWRALGGLRGGFCGWTHGIHYLNGLVSGKIWENLNQKPLFFSMKYAVSGEFKRLHQSIELTRSQQIAGLFQ